MPGQLSSVGVPNSLKIRLSLKRKNLITKNVVYLFQSDSRYMQVFGHNITSLCTWSSTSLPGNRGRPALASSVRITLF